MEIGTRERLHIADIIAAVVIFVHRVERRASKAAVHLAP